MSGVRRMARWWRSWRVRQVWLARGAWARMSGRWRLVTVRAEAGMATAEYALVTLAAAAFAALLIAILRGGQVRDLLFGIISDALSR